MIDDEINLQKNLFLTIFPLSLQRIAAKQCIYGMVQTFDGEMKSKTNKIWDNAAQKRDDKMSTSLFTKTSMNWVR